MDPHNDERNKLDAEFETFLRQFKLRESRPLPQIVEEKQRPLSWLARFAGLFSVPSGRSWAVAAAVVLLVVALSFALRMPGPVPVAHIDRHDTDIPPTSPARGVPDAGHLTGGDKLAARLNPPGVQDKTPNVRSVVSNQLVLQPVAARLGSKVAPDLGGADRFLTHVSIDKPVYRAGETVFIRGVLLRSDGHTPVSDPKDAASVQIWGPRGALAGVGVADRKSVV